MQSKRHRRCNLLYRCNEPIDTLVRIQDQDSDIFLRWEETHKMEKTDIY